MHSFLFCGNINYSKKKWDESNKVIQKPNQAQEPT
jgi:hypothetical protein